MTKFEFTDATLEYAGVILHRIRYVDGSIGGWVEKPENISGDARVLEEAKVFGSAKVYGEAVVSDKARVYGEAVVSDKARVYGNATVFESAKVSGNAAVFDSAEVSGGAQVYGNAGIFGSAKVYGHAEVFGFVDVYGDAEVLGSVEVYGNAEILGDAIVKGLEDYIVFKNWWSSGRYFTWTRSNNMWRVGCFYGTGEELIKKAYQDSKVSGREYGRVVRYVESILAEYAEE